MRHRGQLLVPVLIALGCAVEPTLEQRLIGTWRAELASPAGPLPFDRNPVSLDDERFRGKVVLVNIFGPWCPNCNDKAPVLAEWYRRYRAQGLEVERAARIALSGRTRRSCARSVPDL